MFSSGWPWCNALREESCCCLKDSIDYRSGMSIFFLSSQLNSTFDFCQWIYIYLIIFSIIVNLWSYADTRFVSKQLLAKMRLHVFAPAMVLMQIDQSMKSAYQKIIPTDTLHVVGEVNTPFFSAATWHAPLDGGNLLSCLSENFG